LSSNGIPITARIVHSYTNTTAAYSKRGRTSEASSRNYRVTR